MILKLLQLAPTVLYEKHTKCFSDQANNNIFCLCRHSTDTKFWRFAKQDAKLREKCLSVSVHPTTINHSLPSVIS